MTTLLRKYLTIILEISIAIEALLEAKVAEYAVKIQTFSAESLCLEVSRTRHMITSGAWKV